MSIRISFIRIIQAVGFVAIIVAALPSIAQKEVGIAAIVGDSAISNVDLQERMKIAIFASSLPKSKDLEEKLLPQILRNLVDERLYMKEAENLGVEVTKEDIANVVADIEKRNGIQAGKFNDYLKFNDISPNTMLEQIRSQLTWNKLVSRKVRPQISVTDKEIDEKLEHVSKQAGAEEVNISEILLPVDNAEDDKKIKDIADKLVKQLRQDGNFSKIAKQFSKASSAENGGDIGWIRAGQLPDEVAGIIKSLRTSEVSNPIKILEGYTILKLTGRRALVEKQEESEIGFRHAFIPVSKDTLENERKKIEEKLQKKLSKIKTCNDFTNFAKDAGSSIDANMVTTQISALAPEVSSKVRSLKAGEFSKPIRSADGFNIFMVCERNDAASNTELRNKIREGLLMKKFEIQANRYLRELRRGAFVEIRIN